MAVYVEVALTRRILFFMGSDHDGVAIEKVGRRTGGSDSRLPLVLAWDRSWEYMYILAQRNEKRVTKHNKGRIQR